jgi:hypothetical protein
MSGLLGVSAHPDEITRVLPGDELVPDAQVVMDRAFELPAPPYEVWPWFAQLGKNRAGWYLPRREYDVRSATRGTSGAKRAALSQAPMNGAPRSHRR